MSHSIRNINSRGELKVLASGNNATSLWVRMGPGERTSHAKLLAKHVGSTGRLAACSSIQKKLSRTV